MNYLLAAILIFSQVILAQTVEHKSLIELKSQIRLEQPDNTTVELLDDYQSLKKSGGLAILYSLLLPGMGELYAGDYSLGKYLTIADGVIWGFLFGFNYYGKWQENNYKSFLNSNGVGNPVGKSEKYFADVGNYLDIDQYNRRQELDRNFNEIYSEDTHYWKWDGQAERREYRSMWKSSENSYNNIRFAAGALILNRVISIINAVRLVSKYNNNLQEELSWDLQFGVDSKPTLPTSLSLNFRAGF